MIVVATMNKPFHLMTPAERTAARIAQNRAIDERISDRVVEKNKKPPAKSTGDFVRATPDERASQLGHLVRKVK